MGNASSRKAKKSQSENMDQVDTPKSPPPPTSPSAKPMPPLSKPPVKVRQGADAAMNEKLEDGLKRAESTVRKQREEIDQLERELAPLKRNEVQHEKTVRKEILELGVRLREKAARIGLDCVHHYNIGVLGMTGTGKSALISAILGRKSAAPSSLIEGTMKMERYDHPSIAKLKIWDLPGAGTRNFSVQNYFEEMLGFCFDFVIIVVGNRIQQFDEDFFKAAKEYKVNAAFVRSRSDIDLDNIAKTVFQTKTYDQLTPEQQAQAIKEVRNMVHNYFHSVGYALNYYYVSAHAWADPDGYAIIDEDKMQEELIEQCVKSKGEKSGLEEVFRKFQAEKLRSLDKLKLLETAL